MTVVDVFLAEIFPPKKPSTGAKPPMAGKPPVKPGGDSPFQASKTASNNGDEDDQDTLQPGGGAGPEAGNSDALIAMQNAQKEKEQQEAMAKAAKDAKESTERARIKEMRSAADAEVAEDLDTKFNTDDDKVIWYPSQDPIFRGEDDIHALGKSITNSDAVKDEEEDGLAKHLDKKMGVDTEDDEDEIKHPAETDDEMGYLKKKKKTVQSDAAGHHYQTANQPGT